jgi:excinuclease ABC subunit A
VLHRLTDLGNTVIIIEHNLDVIRNADWILDLGPEGGEGGGRIVAQGTPQQVAAAPDSHTGEFLRRYYQAIGEAPLPNHDDGAGIGSKNGNRNGSGPKTEGNGNKAKMRRSAKKDWVQ